ncbi:MAG TPA: serine protease [Actinoplanes sp.]|nr:serine protease [Actinoplanes sp.]
MRRSVGVLVGVLAVLTVAVAAGVTVAAFPDEGRPIGSWQAALGETRTHVSLVRPAPRLERGARQRVGTLQKITKTIRYGGTPTRQTFHYPGASYVKLHFSRLKLLPGDWVTVADAAGGEVHRYDTESAETAQRWAMSVDGDTAVLHLHRGSDRLPRRGKTYGVVVDQVARGNSPAEQQQLEAATAEPTAPGVTGLEESICGDDQSRDAVCYRTADPVAFSRSMGVARLLINGTELCTGWRLGPKNRMVTNNHCFDDSDDAYETEVWFNYQCKVCGAPQTVRPTKVWGDRVLATNAKYDFTLFTLERFYRVRKFGHLALDARRPNRNEALYLPQHPGGRPTRIAGGKGEGAANCKVVDRHYTGYAKGSDVSYYCDTEGGSSGSPVLSRVTNKVVALHHFGGCPNSGVRGDLILAKIKKLI